MVSSRPARFTASLVRLRHGDPDPRGPGIKELAVPSAIDGEYAGREQSLRPGSYGVVEGGVPLRTGRALLSRSGYDQRGSQAVLRLSFVRGEGPSCGYALEIDADGRPTLTLGEADGQTTRLVASEPLPLDTWHRLCASVDASSGEAVLTCRPAERGARSSWTVVQDAFVPAAASAVVTIGAGLDDSEPSGHFNGKLESPAIFERALTEADTDALDRGEPPWELDPLPLAAGTSGVTSGTSLVDVVGNYHGEFVNQPIRAVTGHRWDGRTFDFKSAPQEHAAADFYDDDLEDAGWEPTFSLAATDDLSSGFYAIRLQAGEAVHGSVVIRARCERSAVLGAHPGTDDDLSRLRERTRERVRSPRKERSEPDTRAPSVEDEYAAGSGFSKALRPSFRRNGTTYVSLLQPHTTMRPPSAMPVSVCRTVSPQISISSTGSRTRHRLDVAAEQRSRSGRPRTSRSRPGGA